MRKLSPLVTLLVAFLLALVTNNKPVHSNHFTYLEKAVKALLSSGDGTINKNIGFRGAEGYYKNSETPSTNVFKFLNNFSGQKSIKTITGARRDLYYQNGKLTGLTYFLDESRSYGWYDFVTSDLKSILRVISKTLKTDLSLENATAWANYGTDDGLYLKKNGCTYLAVSKQIDRMVYQDTQTNFAGVFWTCEGFTVPVKTFLNSIEVANEGEIAAFSAQRFAQQRVPADVRAVATKIGAGETIRYKGERGTDTTMKIRVSPDGKTYRASFTSGKFNYQCQPGKVSQGGRLEEAQCDRIEDEDPNIDQGLAEKFPSPYQYVEGNLEEVERRAYEQTALNDVKGDTLRFIRVVALNQDPALEAELARLRRENAELKKEKSKPREFIRKKEPKKSTPKVGSSGSGFFVSRKGHVITNQHIVGHCRKVTVGDNARKQVLADVVETDRRNDLALLRISSMKMASAETQSLIRKLGIKGVPLSSNGLFRSEDVELGEKVLVSGYPYGEIFSNTIKVTGGMVSANRGLGDDSGQFQMDAAVQPGNSGGPIYDENGNIVGVVVAQLNKMKFAKNVGSIPENVNFGIKASTVRQFLSASGLPTKWSARNRPMSTRDLAKIARKQTVMVQCHE